VSSLIKRIEALEAAQPTTPGLDLSPEAQAATVENMWQRLNAWELERAGMTAEELAALEAAEEAAYWKDRAANPPTRIDVGCRFTMKAALASALQRRSPKVIEDDGGPGELVPSMALSQEPRETRPNRAPKAHRQPSSVVSRINGVPVQILESEEDDEPDAS
jgi:hypothetical protein